MYGMFIHHGLSLTMLERKGIIKIHLVNILQTSTEINDVQISKELFIVQSRQTFDGYGAFQRQANNVLLVYFFSVCSMFVGIEIVHNVTSLASGQNNSPPNFWILLEA